MTATGWVWVAVATVLAALDWAAVAADSRVLERCAKPAVLLALLAAALTAQPRHSGVHGWLMLALCFGLIGDVALSFAAPGHLAGSAEPPAPAGQAEPGAQLEAGAAARPMAEAIRSDTGEMVAAARPAAAHDQYLAQLLRQARAQKVARSRTWQVLLHYREMWYGGWRSDWRSGWRCIR